MRGTLRQARVAVLIATVAACIGSACGGGGTKATGNPSSAATQPTIAIPTSTASLGTTTTSLEPSTGTSRPETATDQLADSALASAPHHPDDINLLPSKYLYRGVQLPLPTEGIYGGSPMSPASNAVPSDQEIRSRLRAFLQAQLGTDQSAIGPAMALLDDATVKAAIPDLSLRAAFAGLTGTSLEPAIQYLLAHPDDFPGGIRFGPVDSLKAPSETRRMPGTPTHPNATASIVISDRYKFEPFELIVALIGHELQHTSAQVVPADEAVTNFELAIEYTEILATHPQLAYVGTELSRRLNGFAQLFLDSHASGSAQNEMIIAGGAGLFPGSSNSSTDIWSDYRGGGIAPAPSVANAVFKELLPGVTLPNPLNYVESTAQLFSHLDDPNLAPAQRLRVGVLLQLLSVHDIATKLSVSDARAITTFDLQPILDIISKG